MELEFLESDFDTLDIDSGKFLKQYLEPDDCPAARALQRYYNKIYNASVTPSGFLNPKEKWVVTDRINHQAIEKMATQLKKGERAFIKIN